MASPHQSSVAIAAILAHGVVESPPLNIAGEQREPQCASHRFKLTAIFQQPAADNCHYAPATFNRAICSSLNLILSTSRFSCICPGVLAAISGSTPVASIHASTT